MIGTDLSFAADLLRKGELVSIPTETVYGLAANALDTDAVLKIYQLKSRPKFNPLILHVRDFEQAQDFILHANALEKKAAEIFWPGPLTIVFDKTDQLPDITTAGLQTVGIRVPNSKLTLALLNQLDFPLAAPSANPSNYISPTSAKHVQKGFGDDLGYVLDGGKSEVGLESTIIRIKDEVIYILRHGAITQEQLSTDLKAEVKDATDGKAIAPGMLKKHYSPRKALYLFNSISDIDSKLLEGAYSFIGFGNKELRGAKYTYNLSLESDIKEAARSLFSMLHEVDEDSSTYIIAIALPNTGLGRAINDKLERASISS